MCSIVEYFAEHEGYKCGYCKSQDTNYSHGMWAHELKSDVYERLCNRGWRRSGKYVYKPTMNLTCCPQYTINCHALDFKLSKSQKKILKKFNLFLQTGDVKKTTNDPTTTMTDKGKDKESEEFTCSGENVTHLPQKECTTNIKIDEINLRKSSVDEQKSDQSNNYNICDNNNDIEMKSATIESNCKSDDVDISVKDTPPQKMKGKKAKEIRLERKRERLLKKGIDLDANPIKKKVKDESKTLENFIESLIEQDSQSKKHKLTIKLVRVKSVEFGDTIEKEFNLYKKYQMVIHNDEENECTMKQFKRFLCDNPLEGEDEDALMGTYHQQYYLDDTLLAVGVIDILSTCVSSVYFFYDPNYMFLALGNFGALHEISFVRKLNLTYPLIKFYYMGFYIHSCVKMRYKGNYSPSYLLCPEEYSWHLLDSNLKAKLDKSAYLRLDTKPRTEAEKNEDIKKVKILKNRCAITYLIYKNRYNDEDFDEIQQYCNLVGANNASKILLYRA